MNRLAVTLALAALSLAFAPAPFPKADRRSALTMAGVWEGEWAGLPVRLSFRPNGSARFEYTKMEGGWDGTWKYDGARKVTLTLLFGAASHDYVLAFNVLGRYVAEGKIQDSPTSS